MNKKEVSKAFPIPIRLHRKPHEWIELTISDETEKCLREYMTKHYPEKPLGKLSKVVEEAIKEYLETWNRYAR